MRYQIIFFAVNATVDVVKRLPPERTAAGAANKATRVVEIAHCLTRFACSGDFLTARVANP